MRRPGDAGRPEPPTALFVCNNAMTAGAMAAVKPLVRRFLKTSR